VVEKILAEHEPLPEDWPVHGDTGYRFGNLVNGLFVDTRNENACWRAYRQFTDEHDDFDEIALPVQEADHRAPRCTPS
jgi:(1->4)-alpha-D-glucan 1-alpha-D-glucosylmutase